MVKPLEKRQCPGVFTTAPFHDRYLFLFGSALYSETLFTQYQGKASEYIFLAKADAPFKGRQRMMLEFFE